MTNPKPLDRALQPSGAYVRLIHFDIKDFHLVGSNEDLLWPMREFYEEDDKDV